MPEVKKDGEIITERFFILHKNGDMIDKNAIQYEILKLTNNAQCTLVEIEIEGGKGKSENGGYEYFVIVSGTKQKLLLLQHTLKAWLQGIMFIPKTIKK